MVGRWVGPWVHVEVVGTGLGGEYTAGWVVEMGGYVGIGGIGAG